jgi:hypothetical protein
MVVVVVMGVLVLEMVHCSSGKPPLVVWIQSACALAG